MVESSLAREVISEDERAALEEVKEEKVSPAVATFEAADGDTWWGKKRQGLLNHSKKK